MALAEGIAIASVSISPDWRVSPYLLLGADLERSDLRFTDRDQRFVANIARIRSAISLNRHLSTDVFIQYNSEAEAILGNFRTRYLRGGRSRPVAGLQPDLEHGERA